MFERTKKFLKKGIQTVKSYFSDGYEKLPKSPSYSGHHDASYSLGSVYSEFVDQRETRNRIMAISYEHNTNNLKHNKPSMLIEKHEVLSKDQQKNQETSSREREEKWSLVTKGLKELEILDRHNVDHVLDIQEILHFYSRLTCPVYREIVEKYFMEMYSEAYNLVRSNNSTPKRIPFRV